ncbi:uncharacterized protein K452DRAFT_304926 [Aplosporella prunicola CBS 121167]|uniref:Peptidase M43 pregnancy-associated plasma-A domain-containing protein n=1 Tax=Aplosporella prunicola CBS 121167 TaxID=1176127 RepID=A0A6A6BTG8_9PEZI|nr:uncharacterized protein K452DRAFT_304926 [Aplosporella prunicola CBS 121167]KAF2145911.1 hypothetical protein K452DRAFT_304926 [Aplosporella prunicola CBS 121167]
MYKFLILLASLGSLAMAEPIQHFDCGTTQGHAKADLMEAIKSLHANSNHNNTGGSAAARAGLVARQNSPIVIDAYFHVVATTAKAGQYTDYKAMGEKQAAVLNKAYNPQGISFTLKETTLTTNDAWAVGEGGDMDAMKAALRKGDYSTLNIYFQSDLAGNILGVCTMPSTVAPGVQPAQYSSDGCSVQAGTMPGGVTAGYNQGMTAVHETGHWLGLFHTFEGKSCSGDGDLIADTRVEASSTNGCPVGKNSCPDVAGVDPIHNYMDYSIDECYEAFTPGQQVRMHELWAQFRAGK